MRVLTIRSFWFLDWWDTTFRNWSVYIFYSYTMDFTQPFSCLVSFATQPCFYYMFRVLWKQSYPWDLLCNLSSSSWTRQITSSTYLFQLLDRQFSGALAMVFCSKLSMYRFTTMGVTRLYIATLSWKCLGKTTLSVFSPYRTLTINDCSPLGTVVGTNFQFVSFASC